MADTQRPSVSFGVHSLDAYDLGKNHQVLAFGYEAVGNAMVQLHDYDPNYPGEEVSIETDARGHLTYSTGESLRGFFLSRYKRADPGFLFDPTITPPRLSLTAILARLRGVVRR